MMSKQNILQQPSPEENLNQLMQSIDLQDPASVFAYNMIQKQIRVNCGPKKPVNLIEALSYRQLYPDQSFYDNPLRDSQSSIFANRIQESPYAQLCPANCDILFGRAAMFQPKGLLSGSIALMRPYPDQVALLIKPRLSNQNRSLLPELDIEMVGLAMSIFLKKNMEHIFVHENVFNDIKLQNSPDDNHYNIPMFMSHFSGIERKNQLILHSAIYCKSKSVDAQNHRQQHCQRSFYDKHKLTDEPYLGPNRPFEDYYTELVYKASDNTQHEDGCLCTNCWPQIGAEGVNVPEIVPIECQLPIKAYRAIHWDLIRMFYCENQNQTTNTTSPVRPLHKVSLHSFDIRYREPGYHPFPIPYASICGYSNGNIRLGIYDRRCTPMRHEINIHNHRIQEVKFHPKNDLQFLVSADRGFLRLYDIRMFPFDSSGGTVPAPVLDFQEHQSGYQHQHIILDPTTNLLVSSGNDNMVRFWNSSTGKLVRCFNPQYGVREKVRYTLLAFYSGDFRYNDCSNQSEVLFTMYDGDYRVFASKIYNSADTE